MFIIRFGTVRSFAAGEALMTQGEPSVSIHFILEGQCRVERQRRSDERPVVLAHLGSGEIVGEMGVLIDLPRAATVIAAAPTRTLELDAPSFDRLARAYPILHRVIARLLSERLHASESPVGQSLPS